MIIARPIIKYVSEEIALWGFKYNKNRSNNNDKNTDNNDNTKKNNNNNGEH